MKGRTVGSKRQWMMFQLRTDAGFEDIIVHSRQVFDTWIGAMAEARRRHRRFLALRQGRESLRPTNEADANKDAHRPSPPNE